MMMMIFGLLARLSKSNWSTI